MSSREKIHFNSIDTTCKVVNRRKDYLHKRSPDLVGTYDLICIENLHKTNMKKNHRNCQVYSSGHRIELELKNMSGVVEDVVVLVKGNEYSNKINVEYHADQSF